jgi:general secretion pathway protein G
MIELLIVMTLVVILGGMSLVQYRSSVRRAEETTLRKDLYHLREAIDQFYADKNKYPSDLSELVSEGYIREVPVDPFTRSRDTWQTVAAEPDPANPSVTGIFNVKSGSDRVALDGTRYNVDW